MQKQTSNKTVYIVVSVIIILLIVAGVGYKAVKHYQKGAMYVTTNNYTNNSAPTMAPSLAPTAGANTAGLSSKSTTDQQLNSDAQSIQGSMNQLHQDQNTATQTLNNQASDIPQQ